MSAPDALARKTPEPIAPSRWESIARLVRESYFTLDRRVLGVFRVWFGLVMLADVLDRLAHATLFYSNDGCLSNHFALFAPMARPWFSLFSSVSTPGEARVALALTALVFAAYLVGYRTRVAQALALLLYTSLNARNLFLENGGTVLVGILLGWTLFLPLGDRYSVDAVLRDVRARREARPRGDPPDPGAPPDAFVTLAALGVALQIAAIYAFNVLHKTGATWGTGQAIHFVLWQNRIATPLAAWLRMREPRWLSPALTQATLLIEGAAPLLVLAPVGQRFTRTTQLALAVALHGGIALLVTLGPFSYVMIALNLLLVPGRTADAVERRVRGGRLAKALGRAEEGLRAILDRVLPDDRRARPPPALRRRALNVGPWVGEAWVATMMVAVGVQVTNDNAAVPARWHLRRPSVLADLVDYPRFMQGWSMFAPDAPEAEGTLVVDARTADGRSLDPFTGRAPDLDAPLHGPYFLGSLLCDYFGRIADAPGYWAGLRSYLLRWQEVEGRPASDRLSAFHVYWVSNDAPLPGETVPRNIQRRALFSDAEP